VCVCVCVCACVCVCVCVCEARLTILFFIAGPEVILCCVDFGSVLLSKMFFRALVFAVLCVFLATVSASSYDFKFGNASLW
jgi:hypothetical protein